MQSQQADSATILVVEDEPLVRLLLADELRAAGYSVAEAGAADEGLALFNTQPDIALLVTDIRMPGAMDGLDLARVIRARGGRTKIIVMSGQTTGAEAAHISDAFIAKPYEPEQMIGLISTLLADRNSPGDSKSEICSLQAGAHLWP